jgi:apolipoprotein N-acyltransferase
MKPLLSAFLLGLLSATGFAPLKLWPMTLLAFAALLWLLARAGSLRRALALGYWFGVGQFTLGLNWIATAFTYQSAMPHWLGWIAVVLLSLYLAVYPAMATGLAWRYGRSGSGAASGAAAGPALVLFFAAAWIVTEWLRATMFTGFAWNPVGVAMLPTPVARLATLVGTYGLSGVTVLIAGTLLLLISRPKAVLVGAAGPVLAAAALILLARPAPLAAPRLPLRIVQPNIGQQDKWTEGFEARNFARLASLTGQAPGTRRLILWPEAAVTDPLQDGRTERLIKQAEAAATRRRVAGLLGPGDLLLTGGITFRSVDGLNLTSATNSVFAMDARGQVLGRFDKAHLVPYGEYLPARPILSRLGLSRLAPGDVDFDPGPGPQTLTLPLAGKVGFQLCYEIIFSGQVVDRANRPAWIYNPSNDAWFGAWGPPQHLAQARLRALEEGLPVLRATPTGISAVIGADGALLHSLPWRVPGVIDAMLPPPAKPTVFAQVGNVAPFLLAALLVFAGWVRRRYAVAEPAGDR